MRDEDAIHPITYCVVTQVSFSLDKSHHPLLPDSYPNLSRPEIRLKGSQRNKDFPARKVNGGEYLPNGPRHQTEAGINRLGKLIYIIHLKETLNESLFCRFKQF